MLSALQTALQTLTRLPARSQPAPPSEALLAKSAIFYPLVGALLGATGWAIHAALGALLPRPFVAALILTAWALLTGALHEDGLADTADALGSQSSRDDILRVMKDSRIGSYGALALILATLLRWQGLAHIPKEALPFALIGSQVLSRAGAVALGFFAGPAAAGYGGTLIGSLRGRHLAATALVALLLLSPWWHWLTLVAAACCLLTVVLLSFWFKQRLAGVTGDCLGAAILIQEIVVLACVLAGSAVSSS